MTDAVVQGPTSPTAASSPDSSPSRPESPQRQTPTIQRHSTVIRSTGPSMMSRAGEQEQSPGRQTRLRRAQTPGKPLAKR